MFDQNPFQQLEPWQIGAFFASFLLGFSLSFFIISLGHRALSRQKKDNKSVRNIRGRISLLGGTLLCLYLLPWLELPHNYYLDRFILFLRLITCLLILLLVNPIVNTLIALLSYRSKKNYGNQQGIFQVFAGIIKMVAISLLLIVLPTFIIDSEQYQIDKWLSNFTIGASTITAVVGFASKDLISNFFGALVIMMGKPFQVGDWIIVNKIEGRVISIETRATKLQTNVGTTIYVPNSMFTNKDITNHGQVSYQCFGIVVPLLSLSEEELKALLTAINQAIKEHPTIIPASSFIEVSDISQEKGKLLCHLSFEPMPQQEMVQHAHALLRQVHAIAKQQGIAVS